MDRRLLKKVPSLLRQNPSTSQLSNRNNDLIKGKISRKTTSKSSSKQQLSSEDSSEDDTLNTKSQKTRKVLDSSRKSTSGTPNTKRKRQVSSSPELRTPLASSSRFGAGERKVFNDSKRSRQSFSNDTTRKRSPRRQSSSEESDDTETFLTKSKKSNNSKAKGSQAHVGSVTTQRKLVDSSPNKVLSEDSDNSDTFIGKPRKSNKSLELSRKVATPTTPVSKRKKRKSTSPESDHSPVISSRSQVRKSTAVSGRNTSVAQGSPAKLSAGAKRQGQTRLTGNSSTQYSSAKNQSSSESEENQPASLKMRSAVTPENRKLTSSGHFRETAVEPGSSTDDDMFNEALPKKGSANGIQNPKRLSNENSLKNKNISQSPVKTQTSVKSVSRPSRSQTARKSQTRKNAVQSLKMFLKHAGIVLNDDRPNILLNNRWKIVEKMEVLLSSEDYDKEEIIKQWQQYIEDVDNLTRVLSQTVNNNQEAFINASSESIARILLHAPSLQTSVLTSLLDRLATVVLVEDSLDSAPWSGLLLRQFKFLEEIVNPDILVEKLGEILELAQKCFQSEIISFLPDIVFDAQHHILGELLSKLLDDNSELIAVILDCISRLTLSKGYMEGITEKAIELLKRNPQLSAVPAITRFILGESSTAESRIKALTALRSIDMQPLAGDNLEECFTNQVLTINALKTVNQVSKEMADAAFTVVQRVKKEPKPLDLVMLLLIFSSNSLKKKNVEALLKLRVKSGFYRSSLLNSLYYDYKEVARDLQSIAIPLASNLLKAGDRVYADFAIEWFCLLFLSQVDANHKQQEVLATIIKLTGASRVTAKYALAVLSKIAHKESEKEHLQKHAHHLRTLLEEIDELDLEEVVTVSDLLHGLCVNSNSTSDTLQADLDIVLTKQLAASKPITKCKGVLGALMAIKHSAAYPRTKNRAFQLFEQVVKAVKTCSRARALFYDQMADVVANTQSLDDNFVEVFTEHFTAELTSLYLTDIESYRGKLSAQFLLNSEVKDSPSEEYAVTFGEGKDGAAVCALFRLIKACSLRGNDGDLSSIDALLGCPVFMPTNLQDPNSAVLDQIFHCINWFRELISAFVTQTDTTMQTILLKRLDQLMTLQSELSINLAMAEPHYQPPICYFHYFPSPPFIKIEKKSTKRSKKTMLEKSSSNSEWIWQSGSNLISKNPAYFRRLDAKIAHMLDFSMELRRSQSRSNSITIGQVCFIVQELLAMLQNEASQTFMKDLVGLLPKVCAKLEQVTTELREKDDSQNRECFRLLLRLLEAIYNWKGFTNFVNNLMLREALRTIAIQTDNCNTLLHSCKELVAQSCSHVESLADVATSIPIAIALVHLVEALIQHSENQQHKENLAKMAFGFLCLDWPDDKISVASYRAAVDTLLRSWLNNEPDPLDTVVTLLKWLPGEAETLSKPQDSLGRMLSINKNCFTLLLKQIFVGMIAGVKTSLILFKRDGERIQMWSSVANGIHNIVQICKVMELKANWQLFLQRFPLLLKLFIASGMPVLEHNLKYHVEEVTGIVKQLQEGTRYLHRLCCHSTVSKDVVLAKYVPAAKAILETLVFSVKGMLVLNNSPQAFWMGNLINKDIKGQAIEMESTEASSTVSISANSIPTDVSAELLTDSSDESMSSEIE